MDFIDLIMFLVVIILYIIIITFHNKMTRVIFINKNNYIHPYYNHRIIPRQRYNRCT